MISRCTDDHWATAWSWWTLQCADRLTCCPTMSPQPWRPGFANTLVPRSWRVTAACASEMVYVRAHQTRFRLLIDSISSATWSTRLINYNASAAPPAARHSATAFELRRSLRQIRRRYRTRHPSPSPVSGGDRTELDPTNGSARERCVLRAGRSRRSVARSVYRRRRYDVC